MVVAFVVPFAAHSLQTRKQSVKPVTPLPFTTSSQFLSHRSALLQRNVCRPTFAPNFIPSPYGYRSVRACAAAPSNPPQILISGPPASGKGTQCEFLVSLYDVVHISTGDMLRAAAKAQTPLGLEAKVCMDAGELVSDELVIALLKERIVQKDCREKGWLLDGFPRTAVQAQALSDAGIIPSSVLLLQVPDEVIIDRVVGRRLDPETGKIYHVKYNPPTDPNVITRLKRRSDDTEEKVRVRLKNYYTHAQSILDQYSGRVLKIDGNRSKEDVFADLKVAIEIGEDTSDDDDVDGAPPSLSSIENSASPNKIAKDDPPTQSAMGLSVSEFVEKAEIAYERGVLLDQEVNWSGQAGIDTAESAGTSNYSDLGRRIDLAAGDAFFILLFAYIGRANHGDSAIDLALFATAAPFLASWFLISPLLGSYTRAATANVSSTIQNFLRAWAVSIPMGLALRGMQFILRIISLSCYFHADDVNMY